MLKQSDSKKEQNQTENVEAAMTEKKTSKWQVLLRAVVFWIIAILLLGRTQEIVSKKYYYPSFENVEPTLNGINSLEKNQLDVLFMGTSHIEYGVSPLQIYEDTGILSYNMSTAKQSVPNTYFLLKRVFKRQNPKVVMVDVSSMFLKNKDNAAWRFLLDSLPMDRDKIEMALAYRGFKNSDGFYAAVFPMIKYHSRWEELREADFGSAPKGFYYSAGQYVRALTMPTDVTQQQMDEQAVTLSSDSYITEVNKENIEWICKIDAMCKEHGSQLVLVKIPSVSMPKTYHSAWTRQRYEAMKQVSADTGIPYVDLTYDVDLGIDYQKETVDEGHHLNLFGARKSTAYIQDYLTEHYEFAEKKNAHYDKGLEVFKKLVMVGTFQNMDSMPDYLAYIADQKAQLDFVLVGKNGVVAALDEEQKTALKKLGFSVVDKVDGSVYYAGYVSAGETRWEAAGVDDAQTYVDQDTLISVTGSKKTFVLVDDKELDIYSKNANLLVIDHQTGACLDVVAFGTGEEDGLLLRNPEQADSFFKDFESKLMTAK